VLTVSLTQGSLTDGDESVLVNASNTNAKLGTGVSAAIRAACGTGYQAQVFAALEQKFGGPMEPGQVLFTDAGAHPRAKWVAHLAVMDYRNGFLAISYPTLEVIRAGLTRLWSGLEALPGPHSVAMVALGGGTGNLGVIEPTKLAARTLKAHLAAHPGSAIERVAFYGYELPEYVAMAQVLSAEFPGLALPPEVRALLEPG
jgi:O-acetyl-ADP-ribose deacetylase (regulator of RNase III)